MIAPSFPPYRGGVETHVHEVGRRLASDARFDVSVLTTDLSQSLSPRETIDGMSVARVPAYPREGDLYWSPETYRRVRRTEADLVHVQGYHTFVPPLAMLAARRAGVPYLLTFHSGGHSSTLRHAIRPIQVRLLRPLLRGAVRLVAVSRFESELFGERLSVGRDRIVTIPNGADLPEGSDPGPLDREPGLILSVGRLERYKGHRRVIEAMPEVRRRIPSARLRVVGDGPDAARLTELARSLGVLDGFEIAGVPRRELPPLLRRAQVVALLSEYESHGLAVQEALSLGARVLINDSSALAEVRALSQVAPVAPDASPATVAEALVSQLEAPQVTDDQVPALPSWDDCAASLAGLYEDIIRRWRLSRASRTVGP
jgi:glycosyltransferase involved in cell wall biosynthesis